MNRTAQHGGKAGRARTSRTAYAGFSPDFRLILTDFRPDAPNHLQRIVRRCLAKDPEDRYQTIKDVAIELRELSRELAARGGIDTGSATSATPVSSGAIQSTSSSSAEYIVTEIRRHKLAAVVALVLAGIGLAVHWRARNNEVGIDSIAVLPFVNQNHDPDTEYLSDASLKASSTASHRCQT